MRHADQMTPRRATTAGGLRAATSRAQASTRQNLGGAAPGRSSLGGTGGGTLGGGGRPGASGAASGQGGPMRPMPRRQGGANLDAGEFRNQAGLSNANRMRQNANVSGSEFRNAAGLSNDRAGGGDPRYRNPAGPDEDSLFRQQNARALNTRESFLRNQNNNIDMANPMFRGTMAGGMKGRVDPYGRFNNVQQGLPYGAQAGNLSFSGPPAPEDGNPLDPLTEGVSKGGVNAALDALGLGPGEDPRDPEPERGTVEWQQWAARKGSRQIAAEQQQGQTQNQTAADPGTQQAPTNNDGGPGTPNDPQTGTIVSNQETDSGGDQAQVGTIASGQDGDQGDGAAYSAGGGDAAKAAEQTGYSEEFYKDQQEQGYFFFQQQEGPDEGGWYRISSSDDIMSNIADYMKKYGDVDDPADGGQGAVGRAGEIWASLKKGNGLNTDEIAWLKENGIDTGYKSAAQLLNEFKDFDYDEGKKDTDDPDQDFWAQIDDRFGQDPEQIDTSGREEAIRAQGQDSANRAFGASAQMMNTMGVNPGVTGAVGARASQQQRLASNLQAESVRMQGEITNLGARMQNRGQYIQMMMGRAQMEQNSEFFEKAQQMQMIQQMENRRMQELRLAAQQAAAKQNALQQVMSAIGTGLGTIGGFFLGGPAGAMMGGAAAGGAMAAAGGAMQSSQSPQNYAGAGGGGYYTGGSFGQPGPYQPGLVYR